MFLKPLTQFLLLFCVCIFQISSETIELSFYKRNKFNLESDPTPNFLLDSKTMASNLNYISLMEELPLLNTLNDEMIVNLCIGTPPQCFNVLVDSGSFYLWVADKTSSEVPDAVNKFDTSSSSTFKDLNLPYSLRYGTGMADGGIATETLHIGNSKLNNLHFILVNKEQGHINLDGILGLGYYYEDFAPEALKFSLIDNLFESKLIKRRIFTQRYTEDKKGKMFIGDLPEEIVNDMENYDNCTALASTSSGQKNPRWQCTLRAVFPGYENQSSNVMQINEAALFDTGTNILVAPLKTLKELLNTYFKDLNKQCNLTYDDGQFYTIACSHYADVMSLPPLNFVFGEWVLQMKPIELFYLYPDNKIRFVIGSHPNMEEQWIIGEPLLRKFHMVFDKDNDVIGFYGTKDKFKFSLPFPDPNAGFYIFLIVIFGIIVIGLIVWLVFWFIKKRKSQVEYYDPNKYRNFLRVN